MNQQTRERILCVDDDPNLLAGIRRQLRKQFDIETALDAKLGLESVRDKGPFAVIVADMRMPGMDGVQFLANVKKIAPDSTRMMLTGDADQSTAAQAVNEGHIFRFLNKPCSTDVLAKTITAGIEQYRLVTAEKELLEKTLMGSIKVMSEVLSLVNPVAFGRASRVQRLVRLISAEFEVDKPWQMNVAAMLSQVGCVTVPEAALAKVYEGADLSSEEKEMFEAHPQIGSNLIANIPRLETVSEVIAYQEKRFDGSGLPKDSVGGEQIPLGARILKVVIDFDTLESKGLAKPEALDQIKNRTGWYDPSVLTRLTIVVGREANFEMQEVYLKELTKEMILAEDVKTTDGVLLVTKGQEVSHSLCQRLMNFARNSEIPHRIRVLIPPTEEPKTESPS